MGYRIYFGLILSLLIACHPVVTIEVTFLNKSSNPPKAESCPIEVLTSPPTERKYQEIAILNSASSGSSSTNPAGYVPLVGFLFRSSDQSASALNNMLPKMKAEACKLGADAIIIKNVESGDSDSPGKSYAVAIKYFN
jgi:hypothetical protein